MIKYTKAFVAMHWLHGLLIGFILIVAKAKMEHLPDTSGDLSQYKGHIILGVVATLLTIIRIFMARKQPELPPLNMSQLRQNLSKWVHRLIYLALLATGVTGVATAKSANLGSIVLFGADPSQYAGSKDIVKTLASAHEISSTILIILILLHIVGVIAYQIQGKGNIIKRIWF